MASKPSRWAVNNDAENAAAAERKRAKEEKRWIREEKERRAAVTTSLTSSPGLDVPQTAVSSDERPSKRRRTTPSSPRSGQDQIGTSAETANLLSFPNTGFGPSPSVSQYTILNPIEEGSYGHVSRARSNSTGDIVALKKLKMSNNNDGFPVTALREIQTLRACNHPHVVGLREVVVGSSLSE